MAENTTNDTTNSNNQKNGRNNVTRIASGFVGFAKKHKFIFFIILATILIIILSVSDYENKKQNAKEDPNNPKNGPAAANEFINNVYLDEEGKLRTEKSVRELWQELKQKDNALTKYLNSPEELAKLFSASMATDYPDTRADPDKPIDWSKYDVGIDSTEVQGIVKFKRALSSGNTITMKYISPSDFQKKMNKYNRTGKAEDRDEALKYFTIERTLAPASGSNSSGLINVGSRSYNNDTLNFESNIDVASIAHNLYGGVYDAIQGCCFDGKYIICSANKGKQGSNGGRIFWVNSETKQLEASHIDVGSEGGHMEGITYDSDRKVVLCIVKNNSLLQIDNQSRTKKGYIHVSQRYRQLAYSVSTHELIGYNDGKKTITFMKYNPSTNTYDEQRTIALKDTHFTNIQGMSCDGQVVYFSDSRPHDVMNPSNYRLWVYDFNGNKVEEHKMGSGGGIKTIELENCYVDKNGTLWIVFPFKVAKVSNYKAHPVDWENNYSPISSTENSSTAVNTQLSEILEYACQWVGKIKYETGNYGELREGGKASCSGFVYGVFIHFGIDTKKKTAKHWDEVPGMEEIGNDLSKASPGDILWTKGSSDCHVAIYLGNNKRIHSTPGHKGVNIAKANKPHKIYHVKGLPKDPGAYFDPETGEYHGKNPSSNNGTTGTSNSTSSNRSSASASTQNANRNTSSTSTQTPKYGITATGQQIINEAEKYVNKLPYVENGKSLEKGANSPGFVWNILKKFGYKGGYCNAAAFTKIGDSVTDLAYAKAGDVVCYSGHVAFYDGKGGIIHMTKEGCKHGKNANYTNIIAIRRFAGITSDGKSSTTTLGPVETEEVFGQFSEETRQIILAHRNDFDQSNFKEFFKSYPGGYDGYLQSLGGVFAKYGGRNTPMNVTDAGTFQEVAEYTWGLFSIWGFNYYNGDFRVRWGADNSEVKQSAFYKGSDNGHYSSGHIDDICSDLGRVNSMRTNCNYGSNAFLQKCGLTEDKNFTTHWKRGQHIDNVEDLQIGDLVHFFGSDGNWHHVAVVGEIDPELGPILYDSGNRFIRSGNYKFPYNSNKYNKYPVRRCRRYFDIDQSTSGQIGTGTISNAKYVFKVKVATWSENTEKIVSTDTSENKYERNYSMNPKSIPYQDIIAQYRMPFNYLWTMLIYSNDKDFTFDLADIVRNSQIEITIHDNLQENKTTITENRTQEYHYSGSADIKMNYTGSLSVSDPQNPDQATLTIHDSVTKTGNGKVDFTEYYKKTTTTTDKANTLDVALTLADAWCVKYERKFKYNGTKSTPGSPSQNKSVDNIEGEDESTITNSTLLSNIKSDARSKASDVLNSMSATITNDGGEVVPGTASQTVDSKITTIITTKVDTKESTYTGEPVGEDNFDTNVTPKFATVLKRHYNARSSLLSAKAWLFESLESNADTANMVDLTKYLMFRTTGTAIDGITSYDFTVYNMQDVGSEYGGSTLNMTSTTISREEFIQKTQSYSAALSKGSGTKTFRDNAGVVYDVCVKNNVNPVLCAAQAWAEQNWVAPGTSPYNYWGIAVYNGQNYGSSYSGMQAAVENYCKNINQRMKGENGALTWSKSNAKYNKKFTGSMSTLYDVLSNWACADDWKTNPAHQAEHAANYVDKIISIAKTIYGEGALSTGVGGGDFLNVAERIWKKICNGNYSYGGSSIPCTGSTVDCSSYVSWVIYEYGYTDFKGGQHCTQNFKNTNWNQKYGWTEINVGGGQNPYDQIQPGDLLVRDPGNNDGHITLVVRKENGKIYCYDCGNSGNWRNNSDGHALDESYMLTDRRAGKIIRVTPKV